jgi:hypothetical protein
MTPPHFCNYLPFEEDLALYLNNLEFFLPKDDLYQVWLKLAYWSWRRKFSKKFQCIFTLLLLSPLGCSPSFEFFLRMICAKSDQNWPSDSGEEVENVKVYRQTDRQTDGTTDNRRSEKLTWAFSSGELKKGQNSSKRGQNGMKFYLSLETLTN